MASIGVIHAGRLPAKIQLDFAPRLKQPAASTNVTIINQTATAVDPSAVEAILYGKDIPLYAGGKALIGGRIIEGPFFGGTQAEPTASFVAYHAQNIVSHAFAYDLTQITSARLRGQEVWNSTGGYVATDKLPPGSFDWRPGHNAQPPFAQSVTRDGSGAVAYAQGIISSWLNLPLKPFAGIVPFPSVMVETTRFGAPSDGIPRSDAIAAVLERMGFSSNEYEVDVQGSDQAWLIGSDATLEEFLQQLRSVFVNYQITYTDKLRVFEPTQFASSFALTNDNVLRDTLQFSRTDPMLLSREKQYSFIDLERDYEPNVVTAKEDRYPLPSTDTTETTSLELPIVTTSAQAMADVYVSLYEELSARNTMEGTGDATLFGMEVGDGVRFADSDVIDFFARVSQTTHDFEHWTVGFQAGEVLNCGAEVEEIDEHSAFPACATRWEWDQWTANFGASGFAFTPPTGFVMSKFTTATWNPEDVGSPGTTMMFSNNNLTASQGAYLLFARACRATRGTLTGKFYFEATWLSTSEDLLSQGCGIARPFTDPWRWSLYGQLGGVFVTPSGNIHINGISSLVGTCGDIRGGGTRCIAVNMDTHRFWARANGGIWNNDPAADPAAGTGGIDISVPFPGPA